MKEGGFMREKLIPPEHQLAGKTMEQWETDVFRSASYFTSFLPRGRIRKEFNNFPAAAVDVFHEPRGCVYAVTANGRSCMLPRALWKHYLELWQEMHPQQKERVK